MIDLRSDTVTRPTPAMLEAMTAAPVGDDVLGDDPTVIRLQEQAADLFGMEAALFCASGTMTNQIAIKVHTRPGEEVICHKQSHIYWYEGGGIMANSGASVRLVGSADGLMDPVEVEAAINPDDPHAARSCLVALENTSNRCGGTCFDFPAIEAIGEVTRRSKLGFHLDGARLFNALVETGQATRDYGAVFNSISICLSKGLGCPVGSLLLGNRDFIHESSRVRKRFGGGWRQAGFLAAAGIYALENHVERLVEDHAMARKLGQCLSAQPYVASVAPVQTNIVVFELVNPALETAFVDALLERGVLAISLGHGKLRMVTHLDLTMDQIDRVCNILSGDIPSGDFQ
jgi:threonine aldolase